MRKKNHIINVFPLRLSRVQTYLQEDLVCTSEITVISPKVTLNLNALRSLDSEKACSLQSSQQRRHYSLKESSAWLSYRGTPIFACDQEENSAVSKLGRREKHPFCSLPISAADNCRGNTENTERDGRVLTALLPENEVLQCVFFCFHVFVRIVFSRMRFL